LKGGQLRRKRDFGFTGFALGLGFTDAEYRHQPGAPGLVKLATDHGIAFTALAALRMADDDILRA
jgi:hypothetical protein